jgi:uncharacterized membrane protein YdjX (TVP38/TMEM64 family)
MTFSRYAQYVTAIADRNALVLAIVFVVGIGFVILANIYILRPRWLKVATWIVGVGGWYATMAAVVVYMLAHAPAN